MRIDLLLDPLPLWGLFVMTIVIALLSVIVGMRLGQYRRRRSEREQEAPLGSVVAATLGLLAFMLAFTFGMTASRFDTRKQLLLDEANAIGTAFLRAGFLPEPQRTEVRDLMHKYVDIRVEVVRQPRELQQAIARSEALQGQLWSYALALGDRNPNSVIAGLFVQSLNEVIDLHAKRVTVGLQYRIPGSIWLALYVISILSMATVGYQFGVSGGTYSHVSLVLAFTFSAVILLIADLDRAREGLIKLNQQPMIELHQKLDTPAQ